MDWAHSEEHLWRVWDEEGQYLLWVPKERRYLLWVPLADHYGGLREEMLAPALRTYAVTMICETLSNVHATNPLCRWTRSELAMRVTRPVGRIGDHCTGKVQCWGGTGLA